MVVVVRREACRGVCAVEGVLDFLFYSAMVGSREVWRRRLVVVCRMSAFEQRKRKQIGQRRTV